MTIYVTVHYSSYPKTARISFMLIIISDAAAKRIGEILLQQNRYALRVSVIGGKCAGFAYQYDMVDEKNEDDTIFEKDDARILVDAVSLPLIDGSEIDFIDDIMGQYFKINNPNSVSSCGCGMSFSL